MPYGSVNADVITTSTAGGVLGAGNASIMKNRLINSDMRIDQRNAGASITPTSGTCTLDRWYPSLTQASKITIQQNAGSVTPPVGFTNYLGVTSSSAYSVGSGDFFLIGQNIEGYNIADLNWGSANAKTVTVSFWVRSSLTGTFSGAINNNAYDRSYVFSYTISAANTWEQKSVTIAGDTTGTWLTTNGLGLRMNLSLGSGSTYNTTANSWQAGTYVGVTGTTSVVGTNGATFYITGVQLEVGSSATGFEYVNYQTSLANCQRYYEQTSSGFANPMWSGNATNGVTYYANAVFLVQKRAAPTISLTSVSNSGFPTTNSSGNITTTSFYEARTANSTANGSYFASSFTASAEL